MCTCKVKKCKNPYIEGSNFCIDHQDIMSHTISNRHEIVELDDSISIAPSETVTLPGNIPEFISIAPFGNIISIAPSGNNSRIGCLEVLKC